MIAPDRIKTPDSFWNAMEQMSIRPSVLLQQAQLPSSIIKPESRMSTDQLFALWHAMEALGGPDIGFELNSEMRETTMPPSFLVAFHAKTVGEAFARVARFKALTAPEEFHIERQGDACIITTSWLHASESEPNALIDATFAFLVNLARRGTEEPISPKQMDLIRGPSEALNRWYDCPITYHAKEARLIFAQSDMERPFVSYNRDLLAMLDSALDKELSEHHALSSLSDQVRWHLRRCMTAGRPELRNIAREMAISERSLQRRLKEEGESFQSLLSDTRRELAKDYLLRIDFDISEIAYLLGYEDQGSFYRAFQKWEDQTPAEWRAACIQTE